MTRRPKTPRTPRQTALLVVSNIFGAPIGGGFRRQPKGRRAKSGQWWRRPRLLRMSEIQSTNYPWQTRKNKPVPDWRDRVVIDEIPDDQSHDEGHSVGGVPARTYRSPFADPNHEGVSEADRASIEMLMMRRSNKP